MNNCCTERQKSSNGPRLETALNSLQNQLPKNPKICK